ncbi:hypothetical protein [Shewanella surugensis]|uniref:Uncharacterized protein n=1 Tax=Shewanella surugensis TaxID=212020 RepID=A0ABT0LBF2_9GAMM|nr:hypothetical protein [Shewanella surugensis]MCL1124506.1 hypothetical protein [Shewanella surugensis]
MSEQTVAFFTHSGDLLAWHSLAGEYQFNQGIGTHDGGMLMVGATQAGQGLVVKMDHKGMVEWQHVMSQDVTVLTHVVQLKSGDFMMIGQSLRDSDQTIATLIRLSRLGEEHWVVHLSSDEAEHTQLSGLVLTHNEDVIIAGTRSDAVYSSLSQGWIARFKIGKKSKQVKLVWETLAGKADARNQINDIVVTSNAIVAVGASNQKSNQYYMDYWVLGVTLKGNTEWEHHYGGIIGNDEAFSVIEMNEAQLVVSGYSSGFSSISGTWLLSLNAAGEIDDFTPTALQH